MLGKSLQPKFGMLTIALEPFFDARVSDVAICPITLSYEKTVEENLHVREMMGIPKPKESTTGLIKARAILDNNYGRIHVKAGQIISVYEMAIGKVILLQQIVNMSICLLCLYCSCESMFTITIVYLTVR